MFTIPLNPGHILYKTVECRGEPACKISVAVTTRRLMSDGPTDLQVVTALGGWTGDTVISCPLDGQPMHAGTEPHTPTGRALYSLYGHRSNEACACVVVVLSISSFGMHCREQGNKIEILYKHQYYYYSSEIISSHTHTHTIYIYIYIYIYIPCVANMGENTHRALFSV